MSLETVSGAMLLLFAIIIPITIFGMALMTYSLKYWLEKRKEVECNHNNWSITACNDKICLDCDSVLERDVREDVCGNCVIEEKYHECEHFTEDNECTKEEDDWPIDEVSLNKAIQSARDGPLIRIEDLDEHYREEDVEE